MARPVVLEVRSRGSFLPRGERGERVQRLPPEKRRRRGKVELFV